MIDFPASPILGQTFTAAGVTWTYDGAKWTLGPSAPNLIAVSDTPPPNPSQGALWWESVNGQMYVFYNDGSSSQWAPTTNQMGGGYQPLQGVTNGSDAAAGQIGEVISSVVASPGVSLGNGVAANITSIALTAGDWDVQGEVWFSTVAPAITLIICWISPTSNTSGPQALNGARFTIGGAAGFINNGAFPLRPARVSLAAPATYYLGVSATGGATNAAFGNIWARRMR